MDCDVLHQMAMAVREKMQIMFPTEDGYSVHSFDNDPYSTPNVVHINGKRQEMMCSRTTIHCRRHVNTQVCTLEFYPDELNLHVMQDSSGSLKHYPLEYANPDLLDILYAYLRNAKRKAEECLPNNR